MSDSRETETAPAPADGKLTIRPAAFQPPREPRSRPLLTLRRGALLTGAVLLAFGGAAWFVLTAKSLRIETSPADADVAIAGGLKFRFADRYLIRPGTYSVAVRAVGHHPLQATLEVGAEPDQHAAYTLKKLPGRLRVESVPVDGARIHIDGEDRGTTPALVRALEPGTYDVRISADRYRPHVESFDIEGRDTEQLLRVELQPAWAEIGISSEPAGADVYIDEEAIGRTPLTAPILEGRRELRVHLPGYKARQERLDVTAGQPLELERFVLEPADATLQLNSRPAGASVTVNGEYRGRTPLELALAPGAASTLRLFKEGYERTVRTLTLASGENQTLNIDLAQERVAVAISVEPPDAELFIDGMPRGRASGTIELAARAHKILVRRAGYVDYETTITPRPGIPQQLNVALKSEEQARIEAIKPIIRSPAGQSLKLFRPRENFTMGASRREPGRRANETLRQVRLERPFYLALYAVTNAEFRAFQSGHSSGAVQQRHSLDAPRQPAVKISWEQAALYCNWLSEQESLPPFYRVNDGKVVGFDARSNGYRLPTEAEWEWAARSRDGAPPLRFPWGDEMPPAPKSGNFADRSAANILGVHLRDYEDGFAVSAPVGSFPPNSRGLFDMGGNVAEWVHDYYDVAVDGQAVTVDPAGPERGEHHVIRGSGWAHGGLTELRLSYRDYGLDGRDDVGFRIARYLE
jgi:formylglycine-generating enzyme required for sulfatase activity